MWLSQRVGSIMSGDCGQATDPLLEPQLRHCLLWARVVLHSEWRPEGPRPSSLHSGDGIGKIGEVRLEIK